MRMHLISGVLVGQVGAGIPLGLAEKVTLIFCVLLVLFAEMLNTALEQLVDLATEQLHEKARITKDAAAGGVLVLAIGTVVIFAAVLVHKADVLLAHPQEIQRQALWGIPLTFCIGALMHESRKPLAVDLLLGVVSLGLWAVTVTWSESYVFSAMTFGFLLVAIATARVRRLRSAARE